MVTGFNAPPKTPLVDPPVEFVAPADQSTKVADRLLQVINEDCTAVTASGGGGAKEDNKVMQIDNPASVLSSD